MGVSTVSDKENCAPPSRTANVMGETLQCAFADASARGLFGSDPERLFEALFLLRAFDRKAEGVFRYTDENAALWKDVLARAHAIVGDAARRGERTTEGPPRATLRTFGLD